MSFEPVNLGGLFDPEAQPDKTALIAVTADGSYREFSYGALDRAAAAVARDLTSGGFMPGARVALLGANSAEYLITYLGIMRAGLVAVPINTRLPEATIDFIIADSEAALVFADRKRLDAEPLVLPAEGGTKLPAARSEPNDEAMILYTSGSTGRPKGVRLSHAGQLWALRARIATFADPAGDRFLVAAPLYHMNALFASKTALMAGATLVLLPSFTPESYVDAAVRFRCTALTSVPTMIARVVKEEARLTVADLSSVKRLTMGSAPQTQALWDKARAALPGARIVMGYGTTEHGPSTFGPHPGGLPTPDLSLGYPLPGNEVRLVGGANPDEGVLEVRCPAVMLGYANLPEATEKVLHDGWYWTGDVMRRTANGFYFFVGRADDMFVCSGENVYPGEVEALLERYPAVHQASVVPLVDEERGMIPIAFIVLRSGAAADEAEIKQFALANAPPVQHPRRVFFKAELPLTGTNKIDRKALAEEAALSLSR
ncbi:MAG TPA: class I adenylate-forming enzyme family protein [Stellaceae bacterium]|nr:class I adenylate-forming enzyme family protein [Stellaceae bacterium]